MGLRSRCARCHVLLAVISELPEYCALCHTTMRLERVIAERDELRKQVRRSATAFAERDALRVVLEEIARKGHDPGGWCQERALAAILGSGDDAYTQCTRCGRKTWEAANDGTTCGMPQPTGEACNGVFKR